MRRKITDEELAEAVKSSYAVMQVIRALGLKEAGGTNAHYSRRIKNLGLDTSHFTGRAWNKGKVLPNLQKQTCDILVKREKGRRAAAKHLRKALLESGVEHSCSKCKQNTTWLGNPLTLDVDHINEDWLDDRLENLRFLCPNCHSQFSRNLLPK